MNEPIETVARIIELAQSLSGPKIVAELFCALSDDQQAEFFSYVAQEMATWNDRPASYGDSWQIDRIAAHMNACACGADGKRWVESLHESLQLPSAHAAAEARP